jgi:hypothetical protein
MNEQTGFKNKMDNFFTSMSEERYAWFVFLVVLSVASFVSISASFTYYYNSDEAWIYKNSLFPNLWDSLIYAHHDVTHPPLSHVRIWLARTILDEVWFIRLSSVICYVGSGFLAFYLGRIIHSPMCGALMAVMLLYSTAIAEASIMVRGYSLMTFWLLVGLIAYYKHIKSGSLQMLILYMFGMSLAVLSEYLAIFIIFAYGASYGMEQLYNRPKNCIKNLSLWSLVNCVILGVFLASYLTQGDVTTANIGWNANMYFENPNHGFFAIIRILLIPIESSILNLAALFLIWPELKKKQLYTHFNFFHIVIPFLLTAFLSLVLDVMEIYPIWLFGAAFRFSTHLVVMYALVLAFFSSIALPKLPTNYRLPLMLCLGVASVWHAYTSRDYGEWSTFKSDIVEQIEMFKQNPEVSTVLLDTQGVYMLSTFHINLQPVGDRLITTLGKAQLISYSNPKATDFSVNQNMLGKFMVDKNISRSAKKYIMVSNMGVGICDHWIKKYTKHILYRSSASILEILPSATLQSLDICK